ncbi:MAG: sigma 54-interacting transcriptional regulator, partial [Pseudomonadota bacterium]|nr:sigma 54-interacting transcriptional regulator [Pseudomonadota bacterium]
MSTHWAPNGSDQTDAGDILPEVERLLVGSSEGMKQVKRLISMVAPAEAPVMVQGETGVGKELVAEALHAGKVAAVRKEQDDPDKATDRVIIELCCDKDSRLGQGNKQSKGCFVLRITAEGDLTKN